MQSHPGALRKRGYNEEGKRFDEGVPVQFLPAYNALIEEALTKAREIDYEGVSTRVLRAEYLPSRSAWRRAGEGSRAKWQCWREQAEH